MLALSKVRHDNDIQNTKDIFIMPNKNIMLFSSKDRATSSKLDIQVFETKYLGTRISPIPITACVLISSSSVSSKGLFVPVSS